MRYTVLQKNLEAPTTEQLKEAFRHVPGLTPVDALTLGRDAFGVLGKNFDLERASDLKHSLEAQGIAVEILEDSAVPQLPETFFLASLECTPDALLLHDCMGRIAELEWRNIMLIAAGLVPLSEFKEVLTENTQWNTRQWQSQRRGLGRVVRDLMVDENLLDPQTVGTFGSVTTYHRETKEEHHDLLLLEIILAGGTIRYSLNSGKAPFLFAHLGERRTNNVLQNFALLIQELLRGAPQACLNRGASRLRENDLNFCYPGKTAFFHEIVWLLWQKQANNS